MGYEVKGTPLFVGLDLTTARIRMSPGAAQVCKNMDLERHPGIRVRAGYARLLDAASAAVSVAAAPSRIFVFERDDDNTRLLMAHGGTLEAVAGGASEW